MSDITFFVFLVPSPFICIFILRFFFVSFSIVFPENIHYFSTNILFITYPFSCSASDRPASSVGSPPPVKAASGSPSPVSTSAPLLRTPPSLTALARAARQAFVPKVAGNIHHPRYRDFWASFNPDPYVWSIICNGYKIPFRDGLVPQAYREPNNRSALDKMPYVQDHVEVLLSDTTVSEVFEQSLCCSPLIVASRYVNGLLKLRLCIDLSRYINLLLKKEAVSLPSLDKALKALLPGDFQATFDLKSAFHHVLIHPDFRKYLGFAVPSKDGSGDRFFVFRVLPFGLATAVQLLARLTKPICIFLAGEGIRLSIYIDNGWILALLRELAAQHLQRTFEVLSQAGFIVSIEKSDTPADVGQVKKHFGFLVDSVAMTVAADHLKLQEVETLIRSTFAAPRTARQVAKLTGKVIALTPALGPIAMVLARLAQNELASFTESHSWSAPMILSEAARDALLLLADSLTFFNGYPIRNEATAKPLSQFIECDASDSRTVHGIRDENCVVASDSSASALCVYDVRNTRSLFHQATFSASESDFSSGHRELLAVKSALQSVPSAFSRSSASSVFWLTDSENLVTFLTKGSSRRPIQLTVLEIYRLTRSLLLDLIPIHLHRSDYRIQVADYGSRFYDPDDWACDAQSFEHLTSYWPATIDLFAHYSNAQLPKFYSFGNSPHTSGVDAFAQSWDDELARNCPPVSLVVPALRKIAASRMQAILVIPAWRSAQFWPFLFPNGTHALQMCTAVSAFRPLIIRGPYCSNCLMQGRPAFPFLALYLRSAGQGYSGLPGTVLCPSIPYVPCSAIE